MEIFEQVSPAIAFVETSVWTGSGVLIEGGYLVTNAHVVWPFDKARVVFPDGSEFLDAPVANWDLLGDLAILGPLDTSIDPLDLVDGEDLAIGSDVFLVGYPGEAEKFPQPSISGGLISRLRESEALGMTYIQTDAALAGGQSGGVLVSIHGDAIGVSGLFFAEAFGLVASAADVLPRVRGLIAGDDVSRLGNRRLPSTGAALEHGFTLNNDWYFVAYVVNEPAGTEISIEVVGDNDAGLYLFDAYGERLISADDTLTGAESGSAQTVLDAPHFLLVAQVEETSGNFQVSSNRNLVPYLDMDDGIQIFVGQTVLANTDYPLDFDYFVIQLSDGDTIDITVDSVMIDPLVSVDFPGATQEQVLFDDDSGGGLSGTNAKLTYRAPHAGTYVIAVQDAVATNVGGYILTVAEAPPGAAAVSPPEVAPVATVESPFGAMAVYESAQYPFSIQYPADWTEQPADPETGLAAQFAGDGGEALAFAEEDTGLIGAGDLTMSQYVDIVLSITEAAGGELLSREQTVTAQGLPAEAVELTLFAGTIRASRFMYLNEDGIAFNATYVALKARHEALEPVIEYSFSTFEVERVVEFLGKWGVQGDGDGQFDAPYGIAVDDSGKVYVTDTGNSRVQVFSGDGEFLFGWGSPGAGDGQFDRPAGIAVVGQAVYLTDQRDFRVKVFSDTGEFAVEWGSFGTGEGLFNSPQGIAVHESGDIYVVDTGNHWVQKFNVFGELLDSWGAFGLDEGLFNLPSGAALDGSGNVYVADTRNHRVQKFTASGEFIVAWGTEGSLDGQFDSPEGIAIDNSGNVYVADSLNHRVQKFSASGEFLGKWGKPGARDGQFSGPTGIAVDHLGRIYVVDSGNHRVQVFGAIQSP